MYSKKLDYQSGRPDLNRRPLDPQSLSGHRWVSPGRAHWALDQREYRLSAAGRGLKSVPVGSPNGSSWARTGLPVFGTSRQEGYGRRVSEFTWLGRTTVKCRTTACGWLSGSRRWSAQHAQCAGDHHERAGEQGDGGRDLPLVADDPVLEPLNRVFGALRPDHLEHGRDEHQREVDSDEHQHRDHRDRGGRLAGHQLMQREEIRGTRG